MAHVVDALALPHILTLREAKNALGCLLPAIVHQAASGDVCVSAGALEKFDSSALAVLLECRRETIAAGRGFSVQALPDALRGLAAVYGVSDLLGAPQALASQTS